MGIPPFKGGCERIQFPLPSLVRRGSGGGRKSRWANPLESPLTKGGTRKVIPKPIFSHLQGVGGCPNDMTHDTLAASRLVTPQGGILGDEECRRFPI
jgi:hypothetical protein